MLHKEEVCYNSISIIFAHKYFKVKAMDLYNVQQGHIGTAPQYYHLWESNPHRGYTL